MTKKITVIGCGKMGGALLVSLKARHGYEVNGVDIKKESRDRLYGLDIAAFENVREAGENDIYILAVKPQDIETSVEELNEVLKQRERKVLVVSIAAGITTGFIKKRMPDEHISVFRVMPNTPSQVSEGMSAVSGMEGATEEDVSLVETIFAGMGATVRVGEEHMDAVTALSGSGPAYFFYMAQIMEKFAKDNGISDETARLLAYQTVMGSAKMIKDKAESFEQLRKNVTSPGGTTQAAIEYLDRNSFARIFYEALDKAKQRSRELSGR